MKSKILLTFFVFSLFTLVFAQRNFSATITVTGFDAATRAEFNTEWSTDLTNVQSRLSDAFATSFAMTDLIGTSKIKNFEIGFGIVGGVTDKFALSGSTDIPSRGVGVAGAIHFGIDGGVFTKALADFDFIIKIFYLPTIKAGDVKIDAFSFGVKPRWHFYKGGTGNVLSWGGLTLACAIDYTSLSASLDMSGKSITTNTNQTGTISATTLTLKGNLFTLTPEVMTNARILYVIVPYLALGTVLNLGGFETTGSINAAGFATIPAGNISVSGSDGGSVFIPYLRTGFEFDLFVLQITVQGQVAFSSKTYYGGGVGLRTSF